MIITKVQASGTLRCTHHKTKISPRHMPETHLKIALMIQQTWISSGWNIKWDFKNRRWSATASGLLPFLWYCCKDLCPSSLACCQAAALWWPSSNDSAIWFQPSEI